MLHPRLSMARVIRETGTAGSSGVKVTMLRSLSHSNRMPSVPLLRQLRPFGPVAARPRRRASERPTIKVLPLDMVKRSDLWLWTSKQSGSASGTRPPSIKAFPLDMVKTGNTIVSVHR